MKSIKHCLLCLPILLCGFSIVPHVMGCSRIGAFAFSELFDNADVIVRATAIKYAKPPGNPNVRTTGEPGPQIEFKVEEVLRGKDLPPGIALNGYLNDTDDFNDVPVPYTFVRPNGRSGSCFAFMYKQGAQFLLFLKKTETGYTSNISPLGPNNEQLRSADDPWLKWVKEHLKETEKRVSVQTAPDAAELTRLLREFLDGASRSDAAVHDRFWAEDLIYTRSTGRRIGKAELMRYLRSAPGRKPGDPTTSYGAEDIRIQQYGDTAVVAFRLVGKTTRAGRTEITQHLNTGTFLRRNGQWQVVSWQATRMPTREEDARNDVDAIEAAFHRAVLDADLKTLESLTDQSFIWTHRSGEQVTREKLLAQLGSGGLKYSKLDTSNVTVSVYGDTAVVRGVSPHQRSSIPGESTGDISPLTSFYTLTFTNSGSGWKAVAMHSSRP